MANLSIDQFLDRKKTKDYNCLDFARDVWLDITGKDLKQLIHAPFSNVPTGVDGISNLTRLQKPESPCLVFMRRMPCVPHVGIYIDGDLLHLTEAGVLFFRYEHSKSYFTNIRFYK